MFYQSELRHFVHKVLYGAKSAHRIMVLWIHPNKAEKQALILSKYYLVKLDHRYMRAYYIILCFNECLKFSIQRLKKNYLKHHAFFMVQLLHPYMTTGKIIALTRWTFVGKAMSLLCNMLSWSLLFFQGASVLISWLQSPSAVILEPLKIKSFTVFPSICHEVMGPDAMILVF